MNLEELLKKLEKNINNYCGDYGTLESRLEDTLRLINDIIVEQNKEIERLNKEIKRLKQKLIIGKKANILYFDEVGVDKE